jgi:hypothetical protein
MPMAKFHQRAPISAQIDAATKTLAQLSKTAVPNAVYRSINVVGRVSERHTIKDIAKAEKVPQKAIRPRIQPIKKAKARSPSRKTKVRLAPLMASRLGKVRQTRKGVSVGRHRFRGAFVADGSKGYGRYIKKGARQLGKKPYQTTTLDRTLVLQRKGKGRYPLEAVKLNIQHSTLNTYRSNVRRAYNQIFPRELATHLIREVEKMKRR